MTSSSAVVDRSRDFFLATPHHDSLEGDKLRCRRSSLFGKRLTYGPGIEGYPTLRLLKTSATAQSLMFPRSGSGWPTQVHLLYALLATSRSSLKPKPGSLIAVTPARFELDERHIRKPLQTQQSQPIINNRWDLPASPCSRFVTPSHLISHRHVNVRSTRCWLWLQFKRTHHADQEKQRRLAIRRTVP